MGLRWMVRTVVVGLAACGSDKAPPSAGSAGGSGSASAGSGSAASGSPALALRLGDCAPVGTTFVSGPRPQRLAENRRGYAHDKEAPPLAPAFAVRPFSMPDVSALPVNHGWGRTARGLPGPDFGAPGTPTAGWGSEPAQQPLGHGAGPASGYGGGAPSRRPISMPQIVVSSAFLVEGDLDPNTVRRYIKRNINKLRFCYEKQLARDPDLTLNGVASLVIAPNGAVAWSKVKLADAEVAACQSTFIDGIMFPKPKSDGVVRASFGLALAPSEMPKAPQTPKQHLGSATKEQIEEAMKRPPFDPEAAVPPELDEPYKPGQGSPLLAISGDLAACFAKHPAATGAAVIDVAPGSLALHGIRDDGLAACIGGLAGKLAAPPAQPLRCALAVGETAVAATPGIDITESTVTLDGTKLGDTASLATDTAFVWKLGSVHAAAKARVTAARESKEPLVVQGPLVLRATDATPMRLVMKVVYSMVHAGDDVVLAAQRGGQWKLLRPIALPVVPVPRGTGIAWSAIATKRQAGGFSGLEAIQRLEVHVGTERLGFLATSTVESHKILIGDLTTRERVLQKYLGERTLTTDAVAIIDSDGDVTYGQVVEVIDSLVKAGFTKWTLTAPFGRRD